MPRTAVRRRVALRVGGDAHTSYIEVLVFHAEG